MSKDAAAASRCHSTILNGHVKKRRDGRVDLKQTVACDTVDHGHSHAVTDNGDFLGDIQVAGHVAVFVLAEQSQFVPAGRQHNSVGIRSGVCHVDGFAQRDDAVTAIHNVLCRRHKDRVRSGFVGSGVNTDSQNPLGAALVDVKLGVVHVEI